MSSDRDVKIVVDHEIACRCPVEAFVGHALDCFDHRACDCLAGCRRVETPSRPWQDPPDWA